MRTWHVLAAERSDAAAEVNVEYLFMHLPMSAVNLPSPHSAPAAGHARNMVTWTVDALLIMQ